MFENVPSPASKAARTHMKRRNMSRHKALRKLEQLETRTLLNANLLTDLNSASDSPRAIVAMGNAHYYSVPVSGSIEIQRSVNNGAPTTLASFPTGFSLAGVDLDAAVVIGNLAYFVANDGTTGRELWVIDHSAGQVRQVRDIMPGENSGVIRLEPSLTAVNGGLLYFVADDGPTGFELWKSGGTQATTTRVSDIFPGNNADSRIESLTVFESRVYFVAENGQTGRELWRVNAAGTGVELVADLAAGATASIPRDLSVMGGELYFTAFHPDFGRELWKLNAARNGVELVADLVPGTAGSNPEGLTVVGNRLAFAAMNGQGLRTVGVSAGSEATTSFISHPLLDAHTAALGTLHGLGNRIVYTVFDEAEGTELWATDVNTLATNKILDLFALESDLDRLSFQTLATGNRLYFSMVSPVSSVLHLGVTDGTAANSHLLGEILPGVASNTQMTSMGVWAGNAGRLYFANSNGSGTELWKSDGTPATTGQVLDIHAGPSNSVPRRMLAEGAGIRFVAGSASGASQVWTSNGTAGGTTLRLTFANQTQSANPSHAVALGSSLLFFADDGVHGREPWVTDGTAAGTTLLTNLSPGGSTDPIWVTSFEGSVYVLSSRGVLDADLWRFDQVLSPPILLKTFKLDRAGAKPVALGDSLYFTFDTGQAIELWKTNGLTSGTVLLGSFTRSFNSFTRLTTMGGKVYFLTDDAAGRRLWSTSGGAPEVVRTFPTLNASTDILGVGGHVYFRASNAASGNELWRSDGTSAGSIVYANIAPGGASSNPNNFHAIGTTLFFTADDGTTGRELWRANTTNGTFTRVTDINTSGDSVPVVLNAHVVDDTLYFIATNAALGSELWRTSASTGALSVVDIRPGSASSVSSVSTVFWSFGSTLYFNANDGTNGLELWTSDAQGTRLFADINQNGGDSNPEVLGITPQGLMVAASRDVLGREPYMIPTGSNQPPQIAPIGDQSVNEGQQLTINVVATDPNAGQTVTLQLLAGGALGAALVGNQFSWTPGEMHGGGIYTITIRATDSGNPPLTSEVSFNVTVVETNQLPTLAEIADRTVQAGTLLSFTATATDPDLPAQTLSFSLVNPPAGAAIDPATGLFTWTPTFNQAGVTNVSVRVTDSMGGTSTRTFAVTVLGNRPPTIAQIGNFGWQVGQSVVLGFGGVASDPDIGQTLTFSFVGSPLGTQATIDPQTGLFVWTPDTPQVATFTVRATDNGTPNLFAETTFQINVAPLPYQLVSAQLGRRGRTVVLILRFNGPLEAGTASNRRLYRLSTAGRDRRFGTRDDVVQVARTALYSAGDQSVTLTPMRAVSNRQNYQFIVDGLIDNLGRAIDGDRDGAAGGPVRLSIRRGLVTIL